MKGEKSGLSREELREARGCEKRGRRTGGLLERAMVQRLREQLWKRLDKEFDVQAVKVVMPLIQAGRRTELEMQTILAAKRTLGIEEQERAVRRMYGPLPWAPAHATEGEESSMERNSGEERQGAGAER